MLVSLTPKAMAAKQRKEIKLKDVDSKDLENFRKATIKEWSLWDHCSGRSREDSTDQGRKDYEV